MQRGFLTQRILFGGFGLLFLIFILFGLTRAQNLILGPSISLSETAVSEGFVDISGTVYRNAGFTINDRSVAPEQNGNFSERLFLSPGHTIITLQARDRFDRTTSLTLPVYIPEYASEEENNNQEDSSESGDEGASQGGEELQS